MIQTPEEIAAKIVDYHHEYGFASTPMGNARYLLDCGRSDYNERLRTFVEKLQENIVAAIRAEREKWAAFADENGNPRKVRGALTARLCRAVNIVLDAVRLKDSSVLDPRWAHTYSKDAHVEITLTAGEIQELDAAESALAAKNNRKD